LRASVGQGLAGRHTCAGHAPACLMAPPRLLPTVSLGRRRADLNSTGQASVLRHGDATHAAALRRLCARKPHPHLPNHLDMPHTPHTGPTTHTYHLHAFATSMAACYLFASFFPGTDAARSMLAWRHCSNSGLPAMHMPARGMLPADAPGWLWHARFRAGGGGGGTARQARLLEHCVPGHGLCNGISWYALPPSFHNSCSLPAFCHHTCTATLHILLLTCAFLTSSYPRIPHLPPHPTSISARHLMPHAGSMALAAHLAQ